MTSRRDPLLRPEFYEVGNKGAIITIAKATCEGHYAALNLGR